MHSTLPALMKLAEKKLRPVCESDDLSEYRLPVGGRDLGRCSRCETCSGSRNLGKTCGASSTTIYHNDDPAQMFRSSHSHRPRAGR